MAAGPTAALAELSDAIATQVAAAAPMLTAIRIGPNRHISGILWQHDLVITSDQALPAQDSYTLVLPGGVLTAARPARRNAAGNLAALRPDGPTNPVQILHPAEPRAGALALALGADADAAPMVHLTVIHKVSASGADRMVTLDLPANLVAEGGPVLDAAGGLLGMATVRHQRRGDRACHARQHGAHARSGGSADQWPARLAGRRAAADHRARGDAQRGRSGVGADGGERGTERTGRAGRTAAGRYPVVAGGPQHERCPGCAPCSARSGSGGRWNCG